MAQQVQESLGNSEATRVARCLDLLLGHDVVAQRPRQYELLRTLYSEITAFLQHHVAQEDLCAYVHTAYDLIEDAWTRLHTKEAGGIPDLAFVDRASYACGCLLLSAYLTSRLVEGFEPEPRDFWNRLVQRNATPTSHAGSQEDLLNTAYYFADMGLLMGGSLPDSRLEPYHPCHGLHALVAPDGPLATLVSPRSGWAFNAVVPATERAARTASGFVASQDQDGIWELVSPTRRIRTTVPVETDLSLTAFVNNYLDRGCPVLIRNACANWPAITKWKSVRAALHACDPRRYVPVEIGSNYTEDSWRQEVMTIDKYLCTYVPQAAGPVGGEAHKPINSPPIGYIAQFPFLDHFPQLRSDFPTPDYAIVGSTDPSEITRLLWIGPADTVTPYHWDPYSNIYCQVSGVKYLELVPPDCSDRMYAYSSAPLTNTSRVMPADVLVHAVDTAAYPEFPKKAQQRASIIPLEQKRHHAILGPGDAVFIPYAWWHYVRSMSVGVSVSNWFTVM